jgi:hypothetical protein
VRRGADAVRYGLQGLIIIIISHIILMLPIQVKPQHPSMCNAPGSAPGSGAVERETFVFEKKHKQRKEEDKP